MPQQNSTTEILHQESLERVMNDHLIWDLYLTKNLCTWFTKYYISITTHMIIFHKPLKWSIILFMTDCFDKNIKATS